MLNVNHDENTLKIKRMLKMKLTQILLASTLAVVAATSFAASDAQSPTLKETQKVVVSTQEQPIAEDATTHSSATQPASEANAEDATPTQPAQ